MLPCALLQSSCDASCYLAVAVFEEEVEGVLPPRGGEPPHRMPGCTWCSNVGAVGVMWVLVAEECVGAVLVMCVHVAAFAPDRLTCVALWCAAGQAIHGVN